MPRSLVRYRRLLPHWRLAGATYAVTWRLAGRQPPLEGYERSLVQDAILHFQDMRYALHAWVVMDDHVHVVATPHDGHPLRRILHAWKSFSAHRLVAQGRTAPVWHREYHDRIIRDHADYREKVRYVLANPLRRWPEADDYEWVGLGAAGERTAT